ncbi:MAG TPA: ATP-binding cassette domain-containing protein [Thermomicrobiales bacterium]|nr:ATP-binding cassette domain-containing protein [Thermomicrobiales bacterium]
MPQDGAAGRTGSRTPVLRTIGLTKRYGAATVVDNLDLAVRPGEVFGFLGPNGAGKTTTIAMVLGLIRPTAGRVELFGAPQSDAALRRVGSLVESPTFYPYLSGRDNLRAVARLTPDVPPSGVEAALERVDLTAAAGRPYRTYSLGMKQRLGIAAALLADPALVVLDEPTNGLDPAGLVQVRGLIRDLAAQGHTVFLSSHLLHEVEQVCDRVAIIRRGVAIAQGSVAELAHDGGRGGFRLLPSDSARAAAVLTALPWVEHVARDGDHLAVQAPADRAFALSEALAGAGIYLGELTRREESLERFFLALTEEGVAPPAGGPPAGGAQS